jgi:hypothetical protein
MGDRQKGVWQMSLAMLISGSIGALFYSPVYRSQKSCSGAASSAPLLSFFLSVSANSLLAR